MILKINKLELELCQAQVWQKGIFRLSFFRSKIRILKKNWGQKNFRSKNFLGQKIIGQRILGQKNLWVIFFFGQKLFRSKKAFYIKTFQKGFNIPPICLIKGNVPHVFMRMISF